MKNKIAAGIFAILLGSIGVQFFYLRKPIKGILCILFCWTGIPSLVGLIQGILILVKSDQEFDAMYNEGITIPPSSGGISG